MTTPTTRDPIRDPILECLATIVGDAALTGLPDDADLRDELDLDSMDFLNLLIAVKEATGVEVPERDYPQVRTLAGLVAYVEAH
jgi:acyl carrier protein